MIQDSTQIRDLFFNCLNSISETPWLFTNQAGDFSRKRKISFSDAILSTICIQRSSSNSEILKYFDFQPDSPTHSALIQQRNKLNLQAFEQLFYRFTDSLSPNLTLKGYRLLAVDGSDIYIPRNPKDTDTYRITDSYGKEFNMLHFNAAYNLMSNLYTDIIIQPVNHINEYLALCDMIDRFAESYPEEKALFIADRGYVSMNVFAHAIESNAFFLVRGRDPKGRSLLATIELPDSPEFDIIFERWLTRRNTKTVKAEPDIYKSIAGRVFDYIEPKSHKLHYISFRIIKFQLSNGKVEYILTNLPKEDFSIDEIRDLYNRRWGIETSFRDIKYAAGILFFHSRKKGLVIQEIYSKLTLYNFSEAITGGIVIQKKDRKYSYSINFSLAISICVEFLKRCQRDVDLPGLEKLLERQLIPIRPGRSSPRYLRARTAVSFLYG